MISGIDDRASPPVQPGVPLVILGATATGKSSLAVAIAEATAGEIVNFDASCVYRGLDIGTAKPSPELRERIPHHVIDCCDPAEEFSAARFVELASAALDDICGRGRQAVLVGGTGLYLRALLSGLVDSPPPAPETRSRLEARESARPGSLHRLLARLDPAAAARITRSDTFRIVRALEHRIATGRRLSADQREWRGAERLRVRKIGLMLGRPEREQRIVDRIGEMLEAGLVEEVRRLLASGVPPTARSLRALGYREVIAHVEERASLDEVRERMRLETRQYAKRQDTWFRREPGVEWHDAPRSPSELSALVRRVMMPTGSRGISRSTS